MVSGFKLVNFTPKDIDTVYFISGSAVDQNFQIDLKSTLYEKNRIINIKNDSVFDIGVNGMPVNREMHIFASDTNLHFIVRPHSVTKRGNSCSSYDYIDSVSVNGVPQYRSGQIMITK